MRNSDKSVKPQLFRKRDFGFICVVIIALYTSLKSSSFDFTLTPAWYMDQRSDLFDESRILPKPIITDLDGNGKNEVILITQDNVLKILSGSRPNGVFEDIYNPEERVSVRLSSELFAPKSSDSAVAMKVGYIDPYNPTKGRSQVIVVMKSDFTVQCYDSSLALMWEKHVAHKSHELDKFGDNFKISEASIYLTPLSIQESSPGMVIVGVSMVPRDPDLFMSLNSSQGLSNTPEDTLLREKANIRQLLSHFSMYALDAKTGHVLWRHDGTDIKPDQYKKSLPQYVYNMDARDLLLSGQKALQNGHDETMYRQSLLAELPHHWHGLQDTSTRLAHFLRRHIGAGRSGGPKHRPLHSGTTSSSSSRTINYAKAAPKLSDNKKQTASSTGEEKVLSQNPKSQGQGQGHDKRLPGRVLSGQSLRFSGVETPPLLHSALLPHDAAEHTVSPNVVVAHTSKGIDVIALRTGAPITSLALNQGQTYADLDGDGVVDTVLVLESPEQAVAHGLAFGHDEGTVLHCTMMVISGLPPRSQLFNGSICQGGNSLHDPMSKHQHNHLSSKLAPVISAASPLVLKSAVDEQSSTMANTDVIVAINTGHITSYNGKGNFNWQLQSGPLWPVSFKHSALLHFDSDAHRALETGSHDNWHCDLLVMGDNTLSLVSRDGRILTTADIPKTPVGQPVLGDFDNDGVTDVIVVTGDVVLGYHLEVKQSVRVMLLSLVIAIFIAVVIFCSNVVYLDVPVGVAASSTAAAISKHRAFSIIRSTDEFHVD